MTKALRPLKSRSFRLLPQPVAQRHLRTLSFILQPLPERLRPFTIPHFPTAGGGATLHNTILRLATSAGYTVTPHNTTLQYVTSPGDSATPHNTTLPPCYTLLHLNLRSFSVLPLTEAQRPVRIQPSSMQRHPRTLRPLNMQSFVMQPQPDTLRSLKNTFLQCATSARRTTTLPNIILHHTITA